MEEKQNFPRATGFSGKILIALLFILSGILLFARNMGWITSEVFDLIVSWHSLLILLGIYAMIRRHFIGGIILFLAGVYFLIGGLSWLPENSQAMVWPLALIIAGVLFIFKPGRNKRAQWARQHTMNHPFSGGCLFSDRRTFLVTGKFTGNGVAPRSDNSRCFIYLQTRQK